MSDGSIATSQSWSASTGSEETTIRLLLKADAAVTGLNGVAYLALAHALDSALGLSAVFVRSVGLFLVAYAAGVWAVAVRASLVRPAVWLVIALNVLWAVDSLVVAGAGWFSPSGVGRAWIVLQAITVGGFAVAQRWALARSNHRDMSDRERTRVRHRELAQQRSDAPSQEGRQW